MYLCDRFGIYFSFHFIPLFFHHIFHAVLAKTAVMTFGKGSVEGSWKWGEQDLPRVSKYTYLGIDFAESGTWDVHM